MRTNPQLYHTSLSLPYIFLSLVFSFLISFAALSQSIPDTEDTQRRSSAAPQPGWTNFTGSCDCSDRTAWGWNGAGWTDAVPVLPTGHTYFMSCGNWTSGGESATGTITGLSAGETYTFTFYVGGFRTLDATYGVVQGSTYRITIGSLLDVTNSYSNPTQWNQQTVTFTTTTAADQTITVYGYTLGGSNGMTHFSFGSSAIAPACQAGTAAPTLIVN